jgi:cell division protease FtsH
MSPKLGLVGYNSVGGEDSMQKPYSDETCQEIDEEVRKIVMECYERTKQLLTEKKHLIEG